MKQLVCCLCHRDRITLALLLGFVTSIYAIEPAPGDLNAQATQLFNHARYAEAEQIYRDAIAGWRRLSPESAGELAITEGNLGTLLRVTGQYAEAEPLLLDWLRQSESDSGRDSVNTARAASSLAALYEAEGRRAEAEGLALRVDGILKRFPNEQAESAYNGRILATIWLDEKRYPEAESLLRKLLPNLPDRLAVGAFSDLATAAIRQDHLSDAEKFAQQAIDLAHRSLPPEHPLLAIAINNLAQAERFQKNYEAAEKHYREAISLWKTSLGPAHPDVAKGLMNLAAFYHERGREAGAEDLYRQAVAVFEGCYGNNHPLTLISRNELGEVLRSQRRFSESEKLSRATLDPLRAAIGIEDTRLLRAMENYARLLEDTKRAAEAAAIRKQIQELARRFGLNR